MESRSNAPPPLLRNVAVVGTFWKRTVRPPVKPVSEGPNIASGVLGAPLDTVVIVNPFSVYGVGMDVRGSIGTMVWKSTTTTSARAWPGRAHGRSRAAANAAGQNALRATTRFSFGGPGR